MRRAAREGDEATLGRAIEETLRFRSPAQLAVRVATEAVTIAGAEIAAGDPVVSWIQAINRDPAAFDRVQSLELLEASHEPVEAPFLHGVQELPARYGRAVDASQTP